MGQASPVYNGKNILGVPLGLSQHTFLNQSMKSQQYGPSFQRDKFRSTLLKY